MGILATACTWQPQPSPQETAATMSGITPEHPSQLRATPLPEALLSRQAATPSATPAAAAETGDRPEPTVVLPTPTPPLPEPYLGIWIAPEELSRLPTSGPAWENLRAAAERELRRPNLSDLVDENNIYVLAKALVYARTGEGRYREEVIDGLMAAIGTEDEGNTLSLGRNLAAYVIAADLINLPADPQQDQIFRGWLRETLQEELEGMTLQQTHEQRPNNWGTHAGASRAAVALYLGDQVELERTAQVFRGWLGDRQAYAGFIYGKLHWQADPDRPVGINPPGAMKEGHSIDGALPEEMRRGGRFRWPPRETNYPWGALQGALVQAEILHRAGYDTWEWEERALLRAVKFLYEIGWPAQGDDQWQVWLINHVYQTDFPAALPAQPGKNMGWTDWTHAG